MICCAQCVFWLALFATPMMFAEEPAKPDATKPDAPKPDSETARWDGLQKQLQAIQKDLAELRKARSDNEAALAIELDVFRERLSKLEKAVEKINNSSRASSYFSPSTSAATGVVRLENRSAVPATVLLGGRSYRVSPLETVVLPAIPAGSFKYEVLAEGFGLIRPEVSRVLASGETFTIAVNP